METTWSLWSEHVTLTLQMKLKLNSAKNGLYYRKVVHNNMYGSHYDLKLIWNILDVVYISWAKLRWDDSVKIDRKEMGCEDLDWTHLAQDRI